MKRNVKLSKQKEHENEVWAYQDECHRLRGILEQQCLTNEELKSQIELNTNRLPAHSSINSQQVTLGGQQLGTTASQQSQPDIL